jgi:hypothetical protein
MIECIFTLDYEIYGNGEGSLKELVYEPAEKLKTIFRKWNAPFVLFVEVAELQRIDDKGTDKSIDLVKPQIREFYSEGFELGLHLHPQWCNAQYQNGRWHLDYSEYNLCTLPPKRITKIIDSSIEYLRELLCEPNFTPYSFRAGNWLFQPTRNAAKILAERGIKIDSSVYKGGLQHKHKLDYRKALKNGYYWTFLDRVDVPDSNGTMLELPIYTQMVPFWKMLTAKRIDMQQAGYKAAKTGKEWLYRCRDILRFWYPLKFDYCRMTLDELTRMMGAVIRQDQKDPTLFRPIIAIGHTKDLIDFETIESFLSYLVQNKIVISTFDKIYDKCKC